MESGCDDSANGARSPCISASPKNRRTRYETDTACLARAAGARVGFFRGDYPLATAPVAGGLVAAAGAVCSAWAWR